MCRMTFQSSLQPGAEAVHMSAGEMVAVRREKRVEHIGAPDVVGEVAILSTCLPELATRYAAASPDQP